jgi:DNA-binding response OmpR family regulator
LIARVRAVLKRSNKEQAPNGDSEMTCDNLSIDLARRQVRVRGKDIHLTATEYNLLHELALHANQVVQHEHLLTSVWGPEYRDDVDYLRAYIYNLRQKLEADPNNPKIILRYPSVGYMLACESHKTS